MIGYGGCDRVLGDGASSIGGVEDRHDLTNVDRKGVRFIVGHSG